MTETKKDPVPVFVIKRLGNQAPEFDMPIDITKLDGTPARLILRCKALKKTEWAAIKDARQREAVEASLAAQLPPEVLEPKEAKQASAKKGAPAKVSAPEGDAPTTNQGIREAVLRTLAANSMAGAVNEALKADSALVMSFAIGWELEDEFNAASLGALEDEFAGSLEAAMNAYDRAIFRGQVGNSKP